MDVIVYDWLRSTQVLTKNTSNVLKGLVAAKEWILNHVFWKVGNGLHITLGLDLWVASNESFLLSQDLRFKLVDYGLLMLGDCGLIGDCEVGIQN